MWLTVVPKCAMLRDRDFIQMHFIIAHIVAQMRGWSANSAGWGGDGGWSAKSGRLAGGWVVRVGVGGGDEEWEVGMER